MTRTTLGALLMLLASTAWASPPSRVSTPVMTTDPLITQKVPSSNVRVEGVYHLMVEDFADGAQERHIIQTPSGRVEIAPSAQLKHLEAGQRVSIRGVKRPNQTVEAVNVEALDTQVNTQTFTTQAELLHGMGEQKTQVYLIRFQDDATAPDYNTINTLTFTDTQQFIQKSSFGNAWLSGQVIPNVITVPYNRSACTDGMLIADYANQVANSWGYPTSAADRHVYVFPKNGCSWSGLALTNEKPSRLWINGSYTLKAMAHEMGHTFGLRHAHAKDCDVSAFGDICTNLPYGDAANIMGNVRTGDYSAYDKERLGWLNVGGTGIRTVYSNDSSNTYVLESYSQPSSATAKVLRVPRGVDANGKALYFYLEKRTADGNDAVLNGQGNLLTGVIVRTVTHGDGDSIYQIDATPNSSIGGTAELTDGALPVGASLTDPVSGVVITNNSPLFGYAASITVTYPPGGYQPPQDPNTPPPPPPGCTRQTPTLTMAPMSRVALTSSVTTYTLTLTNNDDPNNSACTPVTFNASHNVGWGLGTVSLSATSLSVGAGQTSTFTLQVNASGSAAKEAHLLPVSVNTNFPGVAASVTGTLTIVSKCPKGTTTSAQRECVSSSNKTRTQSLYEELTEGWQEAYPGWGS